MWLTILEQFFQSHFFERMGGDKDRHWVGDYHVCVVWNDHGDHGKVGGLGGFQNISGVWIR